MRQASSIAAYLDADEILKKLLPLLKKLSTDTFQYVRAALAENVLCISPLIGKANTNEHIIGIFLSLLKDENPDVRLNLFKKLEELNKVKAIQ